MVTCTETQLWISQPNSLRESIPRLFWLWETTMATCCAPACSQALPVKPQGVWARGSEAWAGSRDRRNLEFVRWGSSGPSSLMGYLFYKYKKLLSQKQNLCVDKSSQTNIFTIGWVCSNILYCEHGVSFLLSPSRIHVQMHPWTAMWRLWVRDDVTIVAIDFEWKNVTQTKQRRDMRLTSRLNRVSMIFLCECDLTWTRTESQVRLGPGPSQVLSQVSSQDC